MVAEARRGTGYFSRAGRLIFAVRSAQIDYLKPARFNQLLSVSVKVAEAGKASLVFDQTVSLIIEGNEEKDSGMLLCKGRVKIACLDANSLKPRAIPTLIRQEILGDS